MFDEGFCQEPLCNVDDAGTPTPFYFAAKDRASHLSRCYLVEIQPYQIGATTDLGVHLSPLGFDPLGVFPSLPDNTLGLTTLRFSDAGYTAQPDGALPSEPFIGRVSQALRLNMALPVAPEAGGRIVLTAATIEIINIDGELDATIDQFDFSGRLVTVKYGLLDYPYEHFATIFAGAIDTPSGSAETFTLTARDRGYRLAVPLQTSLYAGTGGIEGGADLANKPRPIAFGLVRNIAPVLIDASFMVYQFHFRAAQSVDAVYDRGDALAFTADYASYAALTGAALSIGQYATCLALGLIRIGETPDGTLTADVKGDANGSYVSDTSGVIKRILTDFAAVAASEYSAPGFAAFAADVPGVMGWYTTDAQTCEDAISAIVGHCAGWLTTTREGRFTIGRHKLPENGVVAYTYRSYEIIDVDILPPPDGTVPPRYRQTVAYRRNWTVQSGQDVSATVSDDRRLTLSQPYLTAAAQNPQTKQDFILAQDAQVLVSLFDNEADAIAVAQLQIDLLSKQRKTARAILDCRGHLPDPGEIVAIEHPRINGGNLWPAVVLGPETDANERSVNLDMWG